MLKSTKLFRAVTAAHLKDYQEGVSKPVLRKGPLVIIQAEDDGWMGYGPSYGLVLFGFCFCRNTYGWLLVTWSVSKAAKFISEV